jgi:hypothetical protein
MYKIVYSREVVVNTCDASIAICHTKAATSSRVSVYQMQPEGAIRRGGVVCGASQLEAEPSAELWLTRCFENRCQSRRRLRKRKEMV